MDNKNMDKKYYDSQKVFGVHFNNKALIFEIDLYNDGFVETLCFTKQAFEKICRLGQAEFISENDLNINTSPKDDKYNQLIKTLNDAGFKILYDEYNKKFELSIIPYKK